MPEIVLLFSTFILFFWCIVKSSYESNTFLRSVQIITASVVIILFVIIFFNINSFNIVVDRSLYTRTVSGSIIELMILFISFFIIIFSYEYNKVVGILSFEYYIIMLVCICSFCVFVNSNNLILIYVLIELQSICTYILVSSFKQSRYSVEAGIKYFIISAFSSVFVLFGFSFLYGVCGSLQIADISVYLASFYSFDSDHFSYPIIISIIFINIGFLFKIYSAPLHFWVADIYEGSPTSVTMFLATIPLISYIYVFIKLYMLAFYDFFFFYSTILFYFSISSMLFGAIGALVQRKTKKLIAYSSISSVGYILSGVSGSNLLLLQQSFFFLFIYILNIVPIFIFLLNYDNVNLNRLNNIRSFSSLFKQNKVLFIIFSSFFFSLAGIPPFSGFFAKFYLFSGLGDESSFILLFFCVISTLISCYYYIRIIKMIYYDNCKNISVTVPRYNVCLVIFFFFIFNIFFLFFSTLLGDLCEFLSISLYSSSNI